MSLEQPGLAANATDSRTSVTPSATRPVDRPDPRETAPDATGREDAPSEPGRAFVSEDNGQPSRPTPPDPQSAPAAKRAPGMRRARKVRRIVRRIDAWSVLKFSLLFYLCTFLILMVAGVLLWSAAQSAGTIEGVEGFITDIGGYEFFQFDGEQIFRAAFIGGLLLVVAGAAGNVLLSVLFNLISDLVGGIRLTVIEEEPMGPVRKPRRRKRKAVEGRASRRPSVEEV